MNAKNRIVPLFGVYMVLITVLTFVYDYPETLLKRPQSVHNWRQCDGASIALNYYQNGMHFFKPQTHMLYSDNNTTGFSAPSEIPILYYFVALLYKIFGYHEFIFRAVNLLIFYIGLYYLFRLADLVLKDIFYSIVITVFIFTAPLLVYYANNFLPNTVALSFSFIGWYYFYKYYLDKSLRNFIRMTLFFTIAASMKITELTGPIIIAGLMVADRLGIIKTDPELRRQFWTKIGLLLSTFVIVSSWILYAKYYNNLHHSLQFSTFAFPIWDMDKESIDFTLHKMKVLWFKDYFYPATFWFMTGTLVMMFIFWKRSEKILRFICLAEVIALIAFSILWFYALGDHDYFYIGFYVLPAFLFINIFFILKYAGLNRLIQTIIRFVFLSVIVINIFYAQERHSLRYYRSWMNDFEQQKDLYTIEPWLRESGISKDDTIIFYPSVYIRPLYLMNRKGWIMRTRDEISPEIERQDSTAMHDFVNKGAKYFITSDLKSAAEYDPFKPYMTDLHSKYKSIFIFRIPPERDNFNPSDTLFLKLYR